MQFIPIEEARDRGGVRLVATRGIPVPWGEAAKAILQVKRIPYVMAGHYGGRDNPEIVAWTGHNNAPILLCDDEPPEDRWARILLRLERLAPEPRLIPVDEADRALMFGYCHELMDVDGYNWNRRLSVIAAQKESAETDSQRAWYDGLRRKYEFTGGDDCKARMLSVLTSLGKHLQAQRRSGHPYFIGDSLTALDLYWAATCGLILPLPDDKCAIKPGIRAAYTEHDPEILAAIDPILFAHRDHVYDQYLTLPLVL